MAHQPDQISERESFYVHLGSLRRIAGELQAQLETLNQRDAGLLAALQQPPALGGFDEATSLRDRLQGAVVQIYELLAAAREATKFAGDVTFAIANGYQGIDAAVAEAFRTTRAELTTVTTLPDRLRVVQDAAPSSTSSGSEGGRDSFEKSMTAGDPM